MTVVHMARSQYHRSTVDRGGKTPLPSSRFTHTRSEALSRAKIEPYRRTAALDRSELRQGGFLMSQVEDSLAFCAPRGQVREWQQVENALVRSLDRRCFQCQVCWCYEGAQCTCGEEAAAV